jgi:hypothetical protein
MGDGKGALGYVEHILSHLERGSLQGAEEPFRVWLTCFRVLHAQEDSRAAQVLKKAHRLLQEWAGRLQDKELRRTFLAIGTHRELLEAWRRSRTPST